MYKMDRINKMKMIFNINEIIEIILKNKLYNLLFL